MYVSVVVLWETKTREEGILQIPLVWDTQVHCSSYSTHNNTRDKEREKKRERKRENQSITQPADDIMISKKKKRESERKKRERESINHATSRWYHDNLFPFFLSFFLLFFHSFFFLLFFFLPLLPTLLNSEGGDEEGFKDSVVICMLFFYRLF